MHVVNVHQRLLHASPARVSELLATLGQPGDRLWPRRGWPRARLDGPVALGAQGGHGPIRYRVEAWEPGRLLRLRFQHMPGVDGWHAFEIFDATAHHCVLEHRIDARFTGAFKWKWLLAIRRLHDACLEDLLDQAQVALGDTPRSTPWPASVRLLMHCLSRGPGARHAG
jgi:hypothetical protein